MIAGLMLYSSHQCVPFVSGGPFKAHYNGTTFEESGVDKWVLTDEQKDFIERQHIRHVLIQMIEDAEVSAKWNNELQKLAECQPLGVPINISSDPRHGVSSFGGEFKSAGTDVSKWPEGIGMAATFSPEIVRNFAEIASKEYRALGIATALGPQIDLATEPRWMRFDDTFGRDPTIVTASTNASC